MEDKAAIRKRIIVSRDALAADLWDEKSVKIQKNIMKSELYKSADCLMIYADFHGEVGTFLLIEDALLKGKHVFLPKVLENFTESRMEFYEIFSSAELLNGYKGIKEPTGNLQRTFDYDKYQASTLLMLVPGVAFSKEGYRIGYGKGYYDIYLADKPLIIKCGMCFDMQIVDDIPYEATDIKMDLIIGEDTKVEDIDLIKYKN